jgi:predicted nucleic acid-binding protein
MTTASLGALAAHPKKSIALLKGRRRYRAMNDPGDIWARAALRQQGLLIPDMDLLIAATALEHDLTLVTRNQRHFVRLPGLQMQEQGSHPTPVGKALPLAP